MPNPQLCSEADVQHLVHTFYARVQKDPVLGPIFAARIANWDVHLAKMVDFWSSALRGTARYRGTPMVKHAAIPGLSASLFQRWLVLFRDNTKALGQPELQAQADALAERIAESLWYGHPERRNSRRMPADAEHG